MLLCAAVSKPTQSQVVTRPVAIKIPLNELCDVAKEWTIAKQWKHPKLVSMMALGMLHEQTALMMEFVDGSDLHSLIKQKIGLPARQVLFYFQQVSTAVAYLHAKGVVHCDLKPENILICKSDNVKLADFGSARNVKEPLQSLGTLQYAAPEIQWTTKPCASYSKDMWALGVSMFACLTGVHLWPKGVPKNMTSAWKTKQEAIAAALNKFQSHPRTLYVLQLCDVLMAWAPGTRPTAWWTAQLALEGLPTALAASKLLLQPVAPPLPSPTDINRNTRCDPV